MWTPTNNPNRAPERSTLRTLAQCAIAWFGARHPTEEVVEVAKLTHDRLLLTSSTGRTEMYPAQVIA